jgi:predicted nucleic acid-binding protein
MLIVDAAPLVALGDRNDPVRDAVQALFEHDPGPLIVPAPVATEVDHILGVRGGRAPRVAFVEDIVAGRFLIECLTDDDWSTILDLERRYADLDPGLADLSIVAVAGRLGIVRIATFDQRDFRTLRPVRGGSSFELVPQLPA